MANYNTNYFKGGANMMDSLLSRMQTGIQMNINERRYRDQVAAGQRAEGREERRLAMFQASEEERLAGAEQAREQDKTRFDWETARNLWAEPLAKRAAETDLKLNQTQLDTALFSLGQSKKWGDKLQQADYDAALQGLQIGGQQVEQSKIATQAAQSDLDVQLATEEGRLQMFGNDVEAKQLALDQMKDAADKGVAQIGKVFKDEVVRSADTRGKNYVDEDDMRTGFARAMVALDDLPGEASGEQIIGAIIQGVQEIEQYGEKTKPTWLGLGREGGGIVGSAAKYFIPGAGPFMVARDLISRGGADSLDVNTAEGKKNIQSLIDVTEKVVRPLTDEEKKRVFEVLGETGVEPSEGFAGVINWARGKLKRD
ncbi:MAG: hypothetical protein ACYSTZ_02250 [Planctomycetota bacterium]|jgi:hypothetical protein